MAGQLSDAVPENEIGLSVRLDWFLYHVASGHAWFSGLVLIAVAVSIAAFTASIPWRVVGILLLVGALLVVVSATPMPWYAYLLLGVVTIAWIIVESRRGKRSHRRLCIARSAIVTSIAIACVLEVPNHLQPRLEPQQHARLGVIGDSVTAGIGENEAVTWPTLLACRHSIGVHDVSEMGATLVSAIKQAEQLRREDSVVVLEIGGNDLLGGTSVSEFDDSLNALLKRVCIPGRTVVMFELPLPPTFNSFGRVQRRLARQYGVVLVPKCVLMGVLTAPDATLDTIHLSQHGHDQMAEAVWSVVGGAFASEDRS